MKRIEFKDLKPGYHWLKERDGSLVPVEIFLFYNNRLYYSVFMDEVEKAVKEDQEFFELINPTSTEVKSLHVTELFSKTYSGESLADLERDISEAFLDNPAMEAVPVDEYNFHSGAFKVVMTWTPDSE